MDYIDPHCHMISRTTDDYREMALTGCVGVIEPAFWAGYDRYSVDGFKDYFEQLTAFEPTRAKEYGIQHFTWLCLNPKEGEDLGLTEDVLKIIPDYLSRSNVVGIGEIGLNRVTANEMKCFEGHVELAIEHKQQILIHTPHLEDKYKGTKHIIASLRNYPGIQPHRVLIDHAEEHTISMIKENGFWAGITMYPQTKTSYSRAIDMIEIYGQEKICVNSACDWGPSVPTAIPNFILEMRKRGHQEKTIQKIVYDNPIEFLRQSANFNI